MNLIQLLAGRKVQTPHGVWVWEECDIWLGSELLHQVRLCRMNSATKSASSEVIVAEFSDEYSVLLWSMPGKQGYALIAKVEGLDLHKTLLELFESRYHSPIERLIQPGPLFYEIPDTEEQSC